MSFSRHFLITAVLVFTFDRDFKALQVCISWIVGTRARCVWIAMLLETNVFLRNCGRPCGPNFDLTCPEIRGSVSIVGWAYVCNQDCHQPNLVQLPGCPVVTRNKAWMAGGTQKPCHQIENNQTGATAASRFFDQEAYVYWLRPEWKDTCCPHCGRNIWQTGGDPDWGECYDCRHARHRAQQPAHRCGICGIADAVTDVNGYAVCSEACAHEAADQPARPPVQKSS